MSDSQDVEISLGTGRLLALFFGMVVVCAIFFGLGYLLGKNSAPVMASDAPTAATPSGAEKPKAGSAPAQQASAPASSSDELTFFKSVEQKDANPQLAPAPAASPAANASPPTAAEAPRLGAGYVVQIAAVSKQEDAQALVSALRKKSYPVFIASNSPADHLYHVQVGPFADIKDAEAMRSRLAGDGYNPILKK